MLFNSYEFIFLFLPLSLSIYYWLKKHHQYRISIGWLVACSLFFYGWWNPSYLKLILASMLFNYFIGVGLAKKNKSKPLLAVGISANLALLGYYKYTDFFIENVNWLISTDYNLKHIVLPLAISFFTFQQIAFLVDSYRGETKEYNFLQYALFVTFFPQLIAGPIVQHHEMLPQFTRKITEHINATNLMAGLVIFSIGLFKKVMLADRIALYCSPVFSAAEHGITPGFLEAWIGAMGYTMQLYFDFSGYADMAIGSALMFGIKLPINFNSPYKSASIIEFWQRWHMTLSRFLRVYLYFPLGGNRKGEFRRYVNLLLTMLLGGLWHGAGWTFVIWGAMHGVYLAINHGWRATKIKLGIGNNKLTRFRKMLSIALTFLAVVVGWVYFRAESLEAAHRILLGMVGGNGFFMPEKYLERWGEFAVLLQLMGVQFAGASFESIREIREPILLMFACWMLPNTAIIMRSYRPVIIQPEGKTRSAFKTSPLWLFIITIMAITSILHISELSEFLYFQF